jgi:hypothetical protein
MKPRARRNAHHRRAALRAHPHRYAGIAATPGSLQRFAATVLGYSHETARQRIRRVAGKA